MMRGPDLISRAIKERTPVLRRGDAFLHNSPYNGNSHAADHCIFVPVVDDDGAHRFSVLAKAHQADCGNSAADDVHARRTGRLRGRRPALRCLPRPDDYEDNQTSFACAGSAIRVPEQWWGDYLALLGAVRVGERRMLELGRGTRLGRARRVRRRVVRLYSETLDA